MSFRSSRKELETGNVASPAHLSGDGHSVEDVPEDDAHHYFVPQVEDHSFAIVVSLQPCNRRRCWRSHWARGRVLRLTFRADPSTCTHIFSFKTTTFLELKPQLSSCTIALLTSQWCHCTRLLCGRFGCVLGCGFGKHSHRGQAAVHNSDGLVAHIWSQVTPGRCHITVICSNWSVCSGFVGWCVD